MIDLDKAAQAAEALGWDADLAENEELEVFLGKNGVTLFPDGDVAAGVASLTVLAPLIAAWVALAQEGTDGDGA